MNAQKKSKFKDKIITQQYIRRRQENLDGAALEGAAATSIAAVSRAAEWCLTKSKLM